MNSLKKIGKVYNALEERILVLGLVASTVIIFMQVIFRYVINQSISWSEEFCRYLFVWIIWLGTSIAEREHGHLCIEIVSSKLKGKARLFQSLLVKVLVLAMCIFFIINGREVVQSMISRGKVAASMKWLQLWIVYLAIPVSQAVVAIRIVIEIVEDISNFKKYGSVDVPASEGASPQHTEGG